MIDIEKDVAIEMPCSECGGMFRVSLGQVLNAQEGMRHECLARSDTECPGKHLAGLVDRAALESLVTSWRAVQQRARAEGGRLTVGVTEPEPNRKS